MLKTKATGKASCRIKKFHEADDVVASEADDKHKFPNFGSLFCLLKVAGDQGI